MSCSRMPHSQARLFRTGLLLLLTCLFSAFVVRFIPGAQAAVAGPRKQLYSPLVAAQWKFSLPEGVLQKTFQQQGSTARLKRVMMRLLMGRTVRVGALGGSVTLAKDDPGGGGYFGRTIEWLRQAFPKSRIVDRNSAIGGSTTMFAENHLDSQLDPRVDLVFIEYAVNSHMDTSTIFYEDVASYERIVRSVLTGAHSPPDKARPAAAVPVNMWRCCRFNGSHYLMLGFHEHTENYFSILSEYYSLPAISVRNGFHHAYRQGQGIFSNIFREYPPNAVHSMTHPHTLGHKYIADMIVYAMYVVLGQIERYGFTRGDREILVEELPPPMVARELRQVLGSWHAEAVSDVVVQATGWQAGLESSKFGYQAKRPGSSLQLKLDTRVPDHVLQQLQRELASSVSRRAPPSSLKVVVHLELLQSYEHMGMVRARCVEGCACKAAVFDTYRPSRVSITHPYPLPVSSARECVVELTCERGTSSGEHKLSLRGVSVVASIATGPLDAVFEKP